MGVLMEDDLNVKSGRRMQPSDEGQTGSCFVPPSENEEGAGQSHQEGTAEIRFGERGKSIFLFIAVRKDLNGGLNLARW